MNPVIMQISENQMLQVLKGRINAIVKSELINKYSNRNIILAFGDKNIKVKMGAATKISLKKFTELEKIHGISDLERKSLWPNIKVFYLYNFSTLDSEKLGEEEKNIEIKEDNKEIEKINVNFEERMTELRTRRVNDDLNLSNGHRLSDFIPEMSEEEVKDIILEGVPEESIDDGPNDNYIPDNIRYSANQKINELRQKVSKPLISESDLTREIRKDIQKMDLVERFKLKLQGK